MPAGILGYRKFKTVQICARGDNNKIVKIHWLLLKTSYSLKPESEFTIFFKERATSFIPKGDSEKY